jgi:ferric-dicitrate binding protein FerR (iron transport regulator)
MKVLYISSNVVVGDNMKRNTALLAVLCVFLAPIAMRAGKREALPAGLQRAGVISAILPNAQVMRVSAPLTKADFGTELAWSDAVHTDGNGRVRMRLDNDSVLSIGNNSELRMVDRDPQGSRTTVQLGHGLLRAQFTNLAAGETFEVRTPTAVATGAGADFGVDASVPGEVKFVCLEGTVQISSQDASSAGFDCYAGETVVVRDGKPPRQSHLADAPLMGRWRNITDPEEQPQVQYFP